MAERAAIQALESILLGRELECYKEAERQAHTRNFQNLQRETADCNQQLHALGPSPEDGIQRLRWQSEHDRLVDAHQRRCQEYEEWVQEGPDVMTEVVEEFTSKHESRLKEHEARAQRCAEAGKVIYSKMRKGSLSVVPHEDAQLCSANHMIQRYARELTSALKENEELKRQMAEANARAVGESDPAKVVHSFTSA